MGKAEKLYPQMRNNPLDWRIQDVEVVARHFGFGEIEAKGSHTKFYHDQMQEILSVPVKRPIKPVYIKQLTRVTVFMVKARHMSSPRKRGSRATREASRLRPSGSPLARG